MASLMDQSWVIYRISDLPEFLDCDSKALDEQGTLFLQQALQHSECFVRHAWISHAAADSSSNNDKSSSRHLSLTLYIQEEVSSQILLVCPTCSGDNDYSSPRITRIPFLMASGRTTYRLLFNFLQRKCHCRIAKRQQTFTNQQLMAILTHLTKTAPPPETDEPNGNNKTSASMVVTLACPRHIAQAGMERLSVAVPSTTTAWTLPKVQKFVWEQFCMDVSSFVLLYVARPNVVTIRKGGRVTLGADSGIDRLVPVLESMMRVNQDGEGSSSESESDESVLGDDEND